MFDKFTNRAKQVIKLAKKEAQRLNPDNWNYKRQAWALTNAEKDYGTNWGKEVQKLGTKPYYPPRKLKSEKKN